MSKRRSLMTDDDEYDSDATQGRSSIHSNNGHACTVSPQQSEQNFRCLKYVGFTPMPTASNDNTETRKTAVVRLPSEDGHYEHVSPLMAEDSAPSVTGSDDPSTNDTSSTKSTDGSSYTYWSSSKETPDSSTVTGSQLTDGTSYSCSYTTESVAVCDCLDAHTKAAFAETTDDDGVDVEMTGDPVVAASSPMLSEYVRLPSVPPKSQLLVRNAETLGDVFPDWTKRAFVNRESKVADRPSRSPAYRPYNLNQPIRVIDRGPNTAVEYENDPPLTSYGEACSTLLGMAVKKYLKDKKFNVYCSPALASIATACAIAKELSGQVRVRVDVGLDEWQDGGCEQKKRLSPAMLARCGKPVDVRRWCFGVAVGDETALPPFDESIDQYYDRIATCVHEQRCRADAGTTTLVVGNAALLDAAVQPLLPQRASHCADVDMRAAYRRIARVQCHYPHLATLLLQVPRGSHKWSLAKNPIPAFTTADKTSKIDSDYLMRDVEPSSQYPTSSSASSLLADGEHEAGHEPGVLHV